MELSNFRNSKNLIESDTSTKSLATNRGRSAVIIHLVALSLLIFVGCFGVIVGFDSADRLIIFGLFGAATIITWLWSMVLALQDAVKRNAKNVGSVIIFSSFLELSIGLLYLWVMEYERWMMWTDFPVSKTVVDTCFFFAFPIIVPNVTFGMALFMGLSSLHGKRFGRIHDGQIRKIYSVQFAK